MTPRETILQTLRQAEPVSGTKLPEPYDFGGHNPLELFKTTVGENGIQVHEAESVNEIPGLLETRYPQLLMVEKIAIAPRLSHLPWQPLSDRQGFGRFVFGPNDGTALTGISMADAAVARTGGLMFFNREESPASINFLAQDHVILLKKSDIKENITDVLTPDTPTNAVNMIAGPSSTADIAGELLVGVHGPARVICFILSGTG